MAGGLLVKSSPARSRPKSRLPESPRHILGWIQVGEAAGAQQSFDAGVERSDFGTIQELAELSIKRRVPGSIADQAAQILHNVVRNFFPDEVPDDRAHFGHRVEGKTVIDSPELSGAVA